MLQLIIFFPVDVLTLSTVSALNTTQYWFMESNNAQFFGELYLYRYSKFLSCVWTYPRIEIAIKILAVKIWKNTGSFIEVTSLSLKK